MEHDLRILLTGATGFIGQHLLNLLSPYNVVPTSRHHKDFPLDIFCQKNVRQFLQDTNPKILIHLAWDVTHQQFWNSPLNEQYQEASCFLFQEFIDIGGKHIIATGSGAEYPPSDKQVKEMDIVDRSLLTPYGKAKRACCDFLESQNAPFTWFRLFGITGENEKEERFFPTARKSILNKESFLIQHPDIYHDYIDVVDFCKIILKCIESEPWGIVNIGTGKAHSMQTYFNLLAGESPGNAVSPSPLSRIPDCSKLMKLTKPF
ncbi:MAG: hypothetical protein CNLJKLNK_00246 [Holosporales bacterium]